MMPPHSIAMFATQAAGHEVIAFRTRMLHMRMLAKTGWVAVSAFALALTMTPAFAATAIEESAAENARVIGAEADLRQLLGERHQAFARNFAINANPVLLKDGAIFVDGWRDKAPLRHAAAFVHYADGRTVAAWFDEDAGQIVYVGKRPVHPAILVWARRFGPPIHVLSPQATHAPSPQRGADMAASADSPTREDEEELRKVASAIWGGSIVSDWEMNREVGGILGTVTYEIMECSARFSSVPKPIGWVPGWLYIAKSSVSVVAYITGVSSDRKYKICVSAAALNWRSAIELAAAGA
jgi:hypothetical protein